MNRTEESFSKKNKKVASSLDISQSPSSITAAASAAAATVPSNERVSAATTTAASSEPSTSIFGNYFLIILVVILLAFPAIGMMVMSILGNTYKEFTESTSPIIQDFLKFFGYSTGTIINKSADVAADVAKTGIPSMNDTLVGEEIYLFY
jgi:hypothetical protein